MSAAVSWQEILHQGKLCLDMTAVVSLFSHCEARQPIARRQEISSDQSCRPGQMGADGRQFSIMAQASRVGVVGGGVGGLWSVDIGFYSLDI